MGLVSGRPLLGLSLGGTWSGSITNAVPLYQTAWNTGGATGHVVEVVTHFCYPSFTAAAFTQPFAQVSGFYANGGVVSMSLQGFPSGGTVTQLLAGAYDANITAIGQAMAPYSARLICRYAWEGNGTWFPWAAGVIGVANYQRMWAYTIPRLRAAGFTGLFDCNLENYQGRTALGTAPSASLYDIASVDQYATVGDPSRQSDWVTAWTSVQKPSFDGCAALAARDGKRIALPEFSTGYKQDGYGAGDDDYYMTQLAAWIKQHDVAYACAFNGNDYNGDGTVANRHEWFIPAQRNVAGPFTADLTNFPRSVAAWRSSTWTSANLAYGNTPGGGSSEDSRDLTAGLSRRRQNHLYLASGQPPAPPTPTATVGFGASFGSSFGV